MDNFNNVVKLLLETDGCYFVKRGLGDYDIWFSPVINSHFPIGDLIKSRRHANLILRLSGVNKEV